MPAEDNTRPSTQERLSSLGRVMGELVHDLNNEVMALQGWAMLARGEIEAGRLPHTEMDRVAGISDSMARMLRDILDTIAGRALSPEVTFDPLALAETTIADRARSLSGVNLRLHSTLPSGIRIRGRSSFWIRILANLLANATRHAHSQVSVALMVEVGERGEQFVVLRVEDDGPGVMARDRESIFDPFWRGESGEFGLGLSSVQWAVSQLNGGVGYCDSALGGAAFEVRVPLAPRLMDRPAPPPVSASGMEAIWGVRFLILHGDLATREALRHALQPWGTEIHDLDPGDEPDPHLLDAIRGALPDIILLDPREGTRTGLALWSRLRVAMPHLAGRVIFIGNDALDEPARDQVLRTGQPLLGHPIEVRELAYTVSRLRSTQ